MTCLFCRMASGEADAATVYEDDDFLAFLDINPVNKGHALLIPKEHCENLLDFPEELEERFMETAKRVADGVVHATGADGFNLSMNNGSAAGQEIFHAHFHIIPRFEGDGHEHWSKTSYDTDEIESYQERIASHV